MWIHSNENLVFIHKYTFLHPALYNEHQTLFLGLNHHWRKLQAWYFLELLQQSELFSSDIDELAVVMLCLDLRTHLIHQNGSHHLRLEMALNQTQLL